VATTLPIPAPGASAQRRRSWRHRVLPIASALYGALYIVWLFAGHAESDLRALFANLGYVPLMALSTALALQIATLDGLGPRPRWGWRLVSLWCLLNLTGDVVWTVVENVLRRDPSASWVNLAYLASYPVLFAGLLLFTRTLRSRRDATKLALDAAIVMVGGGMLVWHLVIAPAWHTTHASLFQTIVSIAYPVSDLLMLLGVATIVLRCPPGRRRQPMLLLAASIAAMLVGDCLWSTIAVDGVPMSGGLHDVAYMVQYVLLTMSFAAERRRLLDPRPDEEDAGRRALNALPYVAVAAGYGLLIFVARRGDAELFRLVLGAVLLTALVVARQIIALRENILLQRAHALRAGEARFRSLVQHATDVIAILEPDSTITFVSPSALRTLGHAPAELVSTLFLDLVHPDEAADARTRLKESMTAPERAQSGRWRLRHRNGSWIIADTIATNLLGDTNVRGLLLTLHDVSACCALEAQLAHQAFHDPLTGLANRALFLDRVRHTLTRRPGERAPVAVLFLDLDHFKTVNDSLGHTFGDSLLVVAAERLSRCLRTCDTAARLGGDEFAVLLEDVPGLEDVTAIADRITHAYVDPFIIEGREVIISASVGIARAGVDQSADELLRNADLAMYLAKNRGRGQSALFEPAMHAVAVTRLELQNDLRHAAERGELSVAYQPIHALDTQLLVGVEALLRWTHPTRGPIPPVTFIPLAEENGLITSIGRWVLAQACRDAQGWRSRIPDLANLTVSVNLSGRQIPEPTLLLDIQRALDDAGLPPEALILELTESVLLQHTEQARAVMDCLKMLGVGLAIDDFGTGYSSLSYLQQLPLDILKIDRSFIERMETDSGGEALARAVISLATTMSLRTVAEGVEQVTQAERLYALGCDRGQGYFYSPALPADQLEAYAYKTLNLLAG
jgi:diguanylate cyclase (GGDEF)-like protein/PAS domain S-box-containing protein